VASWSEGGRAGGREAEQGFMGVVRIERGGERERERKGAKEGTRMPAELTTGRE